MHPRDSDEWPKRAWRHRVSPEYKWKYFVTKMVSEPFQCYHPNQWR
jgi:hypothetical protein